MGYTLQVTLTLMGLFCICVQYTQGERAGWHRSSYPNPMEDIKKCGRGGNRGKVSLICDPDKIITEAEADQLDTVASSIRNFTKCPCSQYYCDQDKRGYVVATLLVNRIQRDEDQKGYSVQDVYSPIHEAKLFAYTQLKNFKLGRCKEDVILLYTLFDNVVFTYVNEEAQKKLTPDLVSEISKNVRHRLGRGGTIFLGLREILLDYQSVFQGTYKRKDNGDGKPSTGRRRSNASGLFASSMLLGAVVALIRLVPHI